MKEVLIKQKQVEVIAEAIDASQDPMTFYAFYSHIRRFLADLLKDPINAKLDIFLISHGLNKSKLLKKLLKRGIILRDEKINDMVTSDDNHKPTFSIKYKIPRMNYEKKIKRLYSELFEVNLPDRENVENDPIIEDGGATSAAACNATAPIAPMNMPIQRRKIYVTSEQIKKIEEATTTSNCGNYQYDVPFNFKPEDGGTDETMIHKKPGGISMDRLK